MTKLANGIGITVGADRGDARCQERASPEQGLKVSPGR